MGKHIYYIPCLFKVNNQYEINFETSNGSAMTIFVCNYS